MIKSLVIGQSQNVETYTKILKQSNYFSEIYPHVLSDETSSVTPASIFEHDVDAIFILNQLENFIELLVLATKTGKHIYFKDQLHMPVAGFSELEELHDEAGNTIVAELKELWHPIFVDFLETKQSHVSFSFSKSITNRKDIRASVLLALGFITLLSPFPIKRIDVKSQNEQPHLEIGLKMYGGSIGDIQLIFQKEPLFLIEIGSKEGVFQFDLANHELRNSKGMRFPTEKMNDLNLIENSIDAFALSIILKKNQHFPFKYYLLCVSSLSKIENILNGSF